MSKLNNEEFLYISFKANWADEFNVFGYSVMHKSDWDAELKYAEEYFKEIPSLGISIGSNQEIDFEGYDEWVKCFKVTPISEITAQELISINNGSGNGCAYGKFPTVTEYGQDLEYFREVKAKKEAEQKIRDSKTPEQIEEEECRKYLEELKKRDIETDNYQRFAIRNKIFYMEGKGIIKRTPCQEEIIKEYYRILGIPTT